MYLIELFGSLLKGLCISFIACCECSLFCCQASEVIEDLEQTVIHLKLQIQEAENRKQKQLRDQENKMQQEITDLQNITDKKVIHLFTKTILN
ncbi:hypothetical protein cypCar_00024534, partial [Cyprinus carpio]